MFTLPGSLLLSIRLLILMINGSGEKEETSSIDEGYNLVKSILRKFKFNVLELN